jgi:hypothetical protein
MNCLVCGKKFGFLMRTFGSDADDGVCKDCEIEGVRRGDLVLERCDPRADLWQVKRDLDEVLGRYPLPELQQKLRAEFVERMAEALAEKEGLLPADSDQLIAINNEYGRPVAPDSGRLVNAVFRIGARLTITRWEQGEAPTCECKTLLLEKGEVCHWEEPARLLERRSRVEYVGGSQGFSVRLARGLSYRVGAFKGERIDTTYLADCGDGTLHITNRRLAFTGSQTAASVPYKKFISVAAFEDGFQVFRSGAKRPTVLQVTRPELTLQVLGYATPSPND